MGKKNQNKEEKKTKRIVEKVGKEWGIKQENHPTKV